MEELGDYFEGDLEAILRSRWFKRQFNQRQWDRYTRSCHENGGDDYYS